MAGTKTPSKSFNGVSTLAEALARGMKVEVGTYAFDSEYATGGEAMAFNSFNTVAYVNAANRGGYSFEYDATNKKLKAYNPSTGSATPQIEVASSTDLSALSDVMYWAVGW